jgi:hypothetical protein
MSWQIIFKASCQPQAKPAADLKISDVRIAILVIGRFKSKIGNF